MKYFTPGALGLIAWAASASAGPVPIADYLATARKDALIQAREAGGDYRYGTYAGLPFIRDVEVKVRNEGFALSRQRYTLQLSPRGWGEDRASRRYNEAQIGQ
ncbi:MAG: hypothetical protein ABIY63_06700, partial [Fibrobacteria bacterium]